MKHHRDQKGSTLILVLGIVAALAIMATALVTLTSNVMSNTMTNRVSITAFNACESAINTTMLQLGDSWPDSSAKQYTPWSLQTPSPSSSPSPIPAFVSAMKSKNVEWPSPKPTALGPAINVWVYDNIEGGTAGWVSPYNAANPPPWDANADALLYVASQACVGERRARVQVEVTKPQDSIDFPRGTDLWCGGNLLDNGSEYSDSNLKVTYAAPPLDKTATSGPNAIRAYIQGTITATGSTYANHYANLTDYPPVVTTPSTVESGVSVWKSLEEIFSASLVSRIVAKAKADGTYYTTATPPAGMSGFLVIDLTNGGTVTPLPGTVVALQNDNNPEHGAINSVGSPGVILVLGSTYPYPPSPNVTVTMTGGTEYFGVMYTTGNFSSNASGDSPHIRGAVFVQGNVNFKGKDHFYYNDNCIQALGLVFTLTCKQVTGTWREVKPQP